MSPAAGFEESPKKKNARKWRVWVVLAGFALIVVAIAAAVAPWTFSSKALYNEVAAQVKRSSGLFVATDGRSTISLLPRPRITIERVLFADASRTVSVHAEQVRGNLNLLRLLTGRLELTGITLERPNITVDVNRKPFADAGAPARAAAAQPSSPEALKADQEPLATVSIVSGQAQVSYGEKQEVFKNVNATLDWAKVGSPATLAGNFSWRSEQLRVLLWIARPGELLRGEATPAMTRLDGETVHFDAEGMAQLGAKPRFIGRVSGSSPSLRQALNLLDVQVPLPGPIEHIQLAANASAGPRDVQLTNLRLFANDNEFQGSIVVREEEDRPIIQGTLWANFLSLRPMTADLPALTSSDGQWSHDTFDLPDLNDADVDLRISAAHARLARLRLDDATMSLTLRAGRMEIAFNDAKAYKGEIKGSAIFSVRPGEGLDCHINAQTVGVDAGMLVWDAAARSDMSGNLNASVSLDATGDSVAQLMRNLDGRASFSLTQGAVDGINLERALRRLDKTPLSSAIDIRSGRTSFDQAGAAIMIDKGTAKIEEGFARGPGFSLAFAGSARVPDRSFTIKAIAADADSAGKLREKGLQIGFDISGSWDDPSFSLDAQALIKRSGAAAPLLPYDDPTIPTPLKEK